MVPDSDAPPSTDGTGGPRAVAPTDSLGPGFVRVAVAALGGLGYALLVTTWATHRGLQFTGADPGTLLAGVAYGVGGMVLLAAVPLYLLVRLSLVGPSLFVVYANAELLYQTYLGTHLHPVSSHYIVWPLFVVLAGAVAGLELAVRTVTDRLFDRFGTRPLL